jgi:hypothetical protein
MPGVARLSRPRRASVAQRDAAVRLLVECLRARGGLDPALAVRLVADASPDSILEAAAYHRVAGVAYVRLRDIVGLPPALVASLKERYEASLRHHLRIMWELAAIQPVLDDSGAGWAVIKGPVAAELLYDSPGERTYGDLDVLVAPTQFDRVLDSLQEHGCRLLDRNWEVIRRELRGEVHFQMPGGSLLDLHWNLVNIYRGRIRIDTMAMLGRARPSDLGGLSVPTLDSTDSLIHLALHGTLSGGDKLLWMSDIANACRRRPPDWEELVSRAEAWNVASAVGFMLSRSIAVLGADAPGWVPDRLLGRRYQGLMAIADRLSPWQRTGGRLRTPGLMLARSMGFDLVGATRWLFARTLRSFDPREPAASDSFTARGDARDYEAFVRAVVASSARGSDRLAP